jgi:hypothetical protein
VSVLWHIGSAITRSMGYQFSHKLRSEVALWLQAWIAWVWPIDWREGKEGGREREREREQAREREGCGWIDKQTGRETDRNEEIYMVIDIDIDVNIDTDADINTDTWIFGYWQISTEPHSTNILSCLTHKFMKTAWLL